MATYFNSEGEQLSIDPITGGDFAGGYVLCIHDDPPPRGSGKVAPMLLDEGTATWLADQLATLPSADSPREGEG